MLNKYLTILFCLIANIASAFPSPPTPIIPGDLLVGWGASQQTRDSGIAVNSNGSITAPIMGITNGSTACTGCVGQIIISHVPYVSAVALSNGVVSDVTSITLTPGDWVVTGNIYDYSSATSISGVASWISMTATTVPDISLLSAVATATSIMGSTGITTPTIMYNVTVNTPIYLETQVYFSSGTATASGSIIATRIR